MSEKEFTPALGWHWLTPFYDAAIGLFTRERVWRTRLSGYVSPTPEDRILDVGCGTGSLVLKLKEMCASADIHGIDPDEKVLVRANHKLECSAYSASFHQGFLHAEGGSALGRFTKVVSSLVLHQTSYEEKLDILAAISGLLQKGGRIYIADYGEQATLLRRVLFRLTVQLLDGVEDTQHNANGCVPLLMKQAGFMGVKELDVIPTPTGSISIYVGARS